MPSLAYGSAVPDHHAKKQHCHYQRQMTHHPAWRMAMECQGNLEEDKERSEPLRILVDVECLSNICWRRHVK